MTHEEAINSLKTLKPIVEWGEPMEYQVALDLGIEALEKQIPKKPKKEHGVCFCSSCYEYEGHKEWKRKVVFDQDYCDVCGQRLDWSEV